MMDPVSLSAIAKMAMQSAAAGAVVGGGQAAMQGANIGDIGRAAVIGGTSGAVGGGLGGLASGTEFGQGVVGGLASAATQTALSGGDMGDVGRAAMLGGGMGGIASLMSSPAGLDQDTQDSISEQASAKATRAATIAAEDAAKAVVKGWKPRLTGKHASARIAALNEASRLAAAQAARRTFNRVQATAAQDLTRRAMSGDSFTAGIHGNMGSRLPSEPRLMSGANGQNVGSDSQAARRASAAPQSALSRTVTGIGKQAKIATEKFGGQAIATAGIGAALGKPPTAEAGPIPEVRSSVSSSSAAAAAAARERARLRARGRASTVIRGAGFGRARVGSRTLGGGQD